MTPDNIMRELASTLRDVINETPDTVDEAPEEFFHDLACRVILRLSRQRRTIVPVVPPAEERRAEIARKHGEAALRIFDILSGWLSKDSKWSYTTGTMPSGRFEIQLREEGMLRAFFMGESIQDAYGQAAQAISFNGGSLDEANEQHGDV